MLIIAFIIQQWLMHLEVRGFQTNRATRRFTMGIKCSRLSVQLSLFVGFLIFSGDGGD